jgi:hypothetical protein
LPSVAEDIGRSSDVVKKSGSPQVHVLAKMEAEQPIVQCFRQHVEALNLCRDAQPNAFVLNVLDG